jgi:hypothetical protein
LVANTSGVIQVKVGRAVLAGGVRGGVEAGVVGAGGTVRPARSADTVVGGVEGEARVANLAFGSVARVATGAVFDNDSAISLAVSSDEEAGKH